MKKYICTTSYKGDKRPTRSDQYQWKMIELVVGEAIWNTFEFDPDKSFPISDEKKEEMYQLDDQVRVLFVNIINTLFTPRQLEIVIMYASGQTQQEIAKFLGVNQSSVTKSLNGNTDYSDKNGKIYGGCKKKIIKLLKGHSETIMQLKPIMNKIHNVWEPGSCHLAHYETIKRAIGNEDQFEAWLNFSPAILPPKTPINKNQRLKMIEDYHGGMTTRKVSEKYKIDLAQVQSIMKGARR